MTFSSLNDIIKSTHALTPRVAGFGSEYPAGFKLECMAGFVGTRIHAVANQPIRRL